VTSIPNWIVFILVNGLALYSSSCLAGYLLRRNTQASLALVASGIIYFVHLTLVVLVLGVIVSKLNVVTVSGLNVLVSLTLINYFRRYCQSFWRPIKSFFCSLIAQRDIFTLLVIFLFIVQALILLLKVVWLPPHVWDVFNYHLSPAVEWYQLEKIPAVIDSPVGRINGATLGITVLSYWFFIFFRDDFLVELPSLLWALMLVPVSYALLRQSSVSQSWSMKFAIVIFFLPIVLMQAVTVKDHLGLNVSFVAGLLFLVAYLMRKDRCFLFVAAMALGLSLGYKIAAPIHVLVAALMFVILLYMQDKQQFLDKLQRIALVKNILIAFVVSFSIGGYWYVKNLIVYGRLHGAYGLKEVSATAAPLQENSQAVGAFEAVVSKASDVDFFVANIKNFLPRVFDYQGYYGTDLVHISGFGPQFSAFGLAAILMVFAALFNKRLRTQPIFLLGATGVILFTVYMVLNFNVNSYRILSFMPMIMIVYAGVMLHQGGLLKEKISGITINVMLLVSIVWCLIQIMPPQYTNLQRLKEFVSMDSAYRTSATFTKWFSVHRPTFYQLLHAFPAQEPIAYISKRGKNFPREVMEDTWSYPYYDRNWRRKLTYVRQPDYLDCNKQHVCTVKPELKKLLSEKRVALLSSCKVNRCLKILDSEFFEMAPGFYYFRAANK